VATGAIAWEAVRRFAAPEPVESGPVMIVAAVGIVINTATALMFMRGSKEDLNVRGAFLHMAADAAVSAGVVVAAFLMMLTGWLWLDSVTSLLIVAVIVLGTWGLLRDSLDMALDAAPKGSTPARCATGWPPARRPGGPRPAHLGDEHDRDGDDRPRRPALPPTTMTSSCTTSAAELAGKFKIGHATLQIEHQRRRPCLRLAPADVV
jgi:cobalt-zinc-cadmium efflux system protein